jgi:hypothetical protein
MSSPKMKNSCGKSTGAGSKNMTKQCSRVNMFGASAMAKSHTGLTPYLPIVARWASICAKDGLMSFAASAGCCCSIVA